ncbi:UDP-glycosyltransferase 85A8 [Vitis vinifera]|uniref:UDP-glycosyltransferase 85A8 n=1 Tax=Vitis vinifera TaxID=29760 RepID=A0A438HMG1_VITVI|nr:UDP-glycosyltransferase 85A8 [Vitis vinifera]
MGRPHVLIIPCPAQGHVTPLMKFAYQISDHGIKVTFVNSDFIHEKLVAALPDEDEAQSRIGLASIPDGLGPGEDRKDLLKSTDSMLRVMPGHLKELIEKVNNSNDDEKITCVIADTTVGWALEVAEKMGIKSVAFCPCGPGSLALLFHIPRLIEAGHVNGSLLNEELICLAKDIPAFSSNRLPWSCPSPLLASNHLGHYTGNLWPEDSTCISWLDKQPAGSVIYVAFGSLAILSQNQFNELALGIELVGRPFLWVVRSDFTNGSAAEYPDGFIERVAEHGKIVSWAPQEKVLAHPSVACFLSHCGWNSTMDGIGMGVPFLCWPYFADQFHNQSYICDKWKVGLGLNPDENGFISRHEIKKKIEMLVSDDGIKANAEKLKEMARKSVIEGGSSYKNFQTFVEALKQ